MSEATYNNEEMSGENTEVVAEQTYYADFEGGFNMVHLESSNVLNIKTTMSFVELLVEFVMTEDYPLYVEPTEDEYYCYRKGRIFFPNLEEVRLYSQIRPAIAPNGTVDYGNIDGFFEVGGRYYLQGEWGELELASDPPLLEIDELKAHLMKKPPQNADEANQNG